MKGQCAQCTCFCTNPQCTWLLWAKTSRPALMKSAASKQGSNSVVTNLPWEANWLRDSTSVYGYSCNRINSLLVNQYHLQTSHILTMYNTPMWHNCKYLFFFSNRFFITNTFLPIIETEELQLKTYHYCWREKLWICDIGYRLVFLDSFHIDINILPQLDC